jgi:DNA-binding Xre family transcriptional regulator
MSTKVRCIVGSITRALTERKWTRQALSKKADCDRRTIRNADSGKEVRFSTVQQIAQALKCGTETLLDTPYIEQLQNQGGRKVIKAFVPTMSDTSMELLVKVNPADRTAKRLMHLEHVLFWFDIATLTDAQKAALVVLEEILSNSAKPVDQYTINGQLRALERCKELTSVLQKIEASGLHILTGQYNFWTCRQDTKNNHLSSLYESRQHGVLTLVSNRIESGLVVVDMGHVAPQYSDGVGHVYLDGRKLSPEPTS